MQEPSTPLDAYLNRRQFLNNAIKTGLLCTAAPAYASSKKTSIHDEITDFKHASQYNNYFEFTQNKEMVHVLAKEFKPTPWTVECSGLIDHPHSFDPFSITEIKTYTYRFRCVEGWSMVVPWEGIQLRDLILKLKPKPEAKFVKFTSVLRPTEMIGQRRPVMDWPYQEGLRMDEALHPLTILATGMYGQPLPNQSGAPIRLVVPWKYGFKSIKAITKIEFVAKQPVSTWTKKHPSEYGFYANVNPSVDHPRWSQRRELRLGEKLKRRTLMFNGYEDQVAHLYKGMDLEKHF